MTINWDAIKYPNSAILSQSSPKRPLMPENLCFDFYLRDYLNVRDAFPVSGYEVLKRASYNYQVYG